MEDLRAVDTIIFPIHHACHWLMGAIDIVRHNIVIINSMRLHSEKFLEIFRRTEDEITTIFVGEDQSPQWNYNDISSKVPYQRDSYSCGPLTVLNTEYFVKNLNFDYDIKHIISNLRYNICLSIFLQHQICDTN